MSTERTWTASIERRWLSLVERPWLAGGLISLVTTVAIVGLLLATTPRGNEPGSDTSSLVATNAQVPATVPTATTSLPTAIAVAKSKAGATAKAVKPSAKPKATKTTANATPKTTSAAGTAKRGAGGAGMGLIQFGVTYSGRATFYGATGAGNCSFEASSDLMVGAMNQRDYENSQACGAHLSVTGPKGTIRIRVVDRCPECPPGAIDLSQEAFAKIAAVSAGRVPITWRLLSPAGLGPVSYRYKSGSSQNWCGIQVRNHRNPVRSLQVKSGSTWTTLQRQDYNYFVSDAGTGCGGAIRITDLYGNQLTDTGIRISPDQTQSGRGQFPAR